MEYPLTNIYEMADELDWSDEWGEEPESKEERIYKIRENMKKAPKLIPIFSHRYMPLCTMRKYPILSVHGIDIVYYGENLDQYIEVEFGNKRQEALEYSGMEYIPFWSDLM